MNWPWKMLIKLWTDPIHSLWTIWNCLSLRKSVHPFDILSFSMSVHILNVWWFCFWKKNTVHYFIIDYTFFRAGSISDSTESTISHTNRHKYSTRRNFQRQCHTCQQTKLSHTDDTRKFTNSTGKSLYNYFLLPEYFTKRHFIWINAIYLYISSILISRSLKRGATTAYRMKNLQKNGTISSRDDRRTEKF